MDSALNHPYQLKFGRNWPIIASQSSLMQQKELVLSCAQRGFFNAPQPASEGMNQFLLNLASKAMVFVVEPFKKLLSSILIQDLLAQACQVLKQMTQQICSCFPNTSSLMRPHTSYILLHPPTAHRRRSARLVTFGAFPSMHRAALAQSMAWMLRAVQGIGPLWPTPSLGLQVPMGLALGLAYLP